MNLAALHEKPPARKRRWRVTTPRVKTELFQRTAEEGTPANASLGTTAEPASTGAHLALTVLQTQDVPAKTSRGTLVEPWLAETVGQLPEIS
ncbi:hypothetical protein E2C01_049664 [Portunus trituberculatus]|uniref:Uncharacterized protein n=1 Tax=Portunus trituberculatus TaxID=210409 RepID=A0A5B7G678_PORTR|nr:hypothetical protein [Portunus trituberculatus]